MRATYFVNPHSDFYNISEKNTLSSLLEILSLGHELGLHLDCDFYGSGSKDLDATIIREADFLESLTGVRPLAFSFHNPTHQDLLNENSRYGGLVNCYSAYFKTVAAYCSDSNGYWRFHRLRDVLSQKDARCLQVLTHPGWWHRSAPADANA